MTRSIFLMTLVGILAGPSAWAAKGDAGDRDRIAALVVMHQQHVHPTGSAEVFAKVILTHRPADVMAVALTDEAGRFRPIRYHPHDQQISVVLLRLGSPSPAPGARLVGMAETAETTRGGGRGPSGYSGGWAEQWTGAPPMPDDPVSVERDDGTSPGFAASMVGLALGVPIFAGLALASGYWTMMLVPVVLGLFVATLEQLRPA